MQEVPAEVISTANEKSRRLRELIQAPEILIMPGAFNVLSALLFQRLGFKAVQGSSSAIANSVGRPDLGIGRERTVAVIRRRWPRPSGAVRRSPRPAQSASSLGESRTLKR